MSAHEHAADFMLSKCSWCYHPIDDVALWCPCCNGDASLLQEALLNPKLLTEILVDTDANGNTTPRFKNLAAVQQAVTALLIAATRAAFLTRSVSFECTELTADPANPVDTVSKMARALRSLMFEASKILGDSNNVISTHQALHMAQDVIEVGESVMSVAVSCASSTCSSYAVMAMLSNDCT